MGFTLGILNFVAHGVILQLLYNFFEILAEEFPSFIFFVLSTCRLPPAAITCFVFDSIFPYLSLNQTCSPILKLKWKSKLSRTQFQEKIAIIGFEFK